MALDLSQTKQYGRATLDIQSGLGGVRSVTATIGGTTYPQAHLSTNSLTVTITESTSGVSPPGGTWYVAIVPDDTDIAGVLTSGSVIDSASLGVGGSLAASVPLTHDGRVGTVRIVLAAGDNAARAQNPAGTNTGGTSPEFHIDSDAAANTARGGFAPTRDAAEIGSWHRNAEGGFVSITGDNFRYGQQLQIDGSLNATPINPKSIAVGIGPNSNTTSPTKFADVQVSGGGLASAVANIDTDFTSSPSDYFGLIGVNNTFGRSTTSTAQLPGLYATGTAPTGLSTSQRAWVTFGSPLDSKADAGTTTVGSGISINSVQSYAESGRTNLSAGFTRSDGSMAPNDTPYLRAVIHDAYGSPLLSTNITMAVLDSDGTQENSQALVTDGSGQIDWSYVISTSHKGFSRFKKTSPDNPDSLGTHDGLFQAYRPAGSKTNQYPGPLLTTATRSFAGNQPARAKDVRLTGRAYGTKEPQNVVADVFGVSSEIIIEGMWSGNTTDRSDDVNGSPLGPIARSKVTAAGSFALKTCSLVNEGAFGVADAATHNPSDIWGRPFQNHAFVGARSLYDSTNVAVLDAGSALTASENLDDPLGYSIHGNDTQTYDLVSAPSDAATYYYYQAFAGSPGQRDTYSFTSTSNRGFTSDIGLYGYKRQVIEYSIVRDDLAMVAAMSNAQPAVNSATTGIVTAVQILPDNTLLPSTFDGAPRYVIHEVTGAGIPLSIVADGECDLIAGSEDYEFSYTPTSPGTYGVTIFGKVAGSRPTPGRTSFSSGFDTDIKLLVVPSVLQSDPTLVRRYTIKVAKGVGANLNDINPDSAPRYYVLGSPQTGKIEVLATGLAIAIGAEPTPDWEFDVTVPLGYESVKVYVTAEVGGAPVIGGDVQAIQIGYQFDAVAFAAGIPFK